ncbi:putative calcium-transporting ATPase 7, plasma membrane-type [Capsicum chinense]|nr:putative calcium-transporting ATPase 7, plasma membrane-type [Capsicum chinense]
MTLTDILSGRADAQDYCLCDAECPDKGLIIEKIYVMYALLLCFLTLKAGRQAGKLIKVEPFNSIKKCIGIVGINDHVRPGVRESVTLCCSAGVNVRKVTGDNINTTTTVTREYGLLIDAGIAIEGPVFRDKTQEKMLNLIP